MFRSLRRRLTGRARDQMLRAWNRLAGPAGRRAAARAFHHDLISQTDNFAHVNWLGQPIWQNVLDLWTIQETIGEIRPALLIEVGTHRGGSALFYAHLMDLMGHGRVVTIDIVKLHELDHPRVEFLLGNSTDPEVVQRVRRVAAQADGPVMVILDGDHSRDQVAAELELYAPFVTPGSVLLSQDGIIDESWRFAKGRPGPLLANLEFLRRHDEFEHDADRNERFLLTHHPLGWMRRRAE